LENAQFQDGLNLKRQTAEQRAPQFLFNVTRFLGALVMAISIVLVVARVSVPAAILIFLAALPPMLFMPWLSRVWRLAFEETSLDNRLINDLTVSMMRPGGYLDLTVNGGLETVIEEISARLAHKRKRMGHAFTMDGLLAIACAIPIALCMTGALLILTRNGATPGGTAMVLTALTALFAFTELSVAFTKIAEATPYIVELVNATADPPLPVEPRVWQGERVDAVSFRDAGFAYAQADQVVQGACGSLESGKLHAIIGPNGAGKSTLAKMLVGLYTPATGSVEWHRKGERTAPDITSVSVLPQDPPTFPISIGSYLRMGAHASDEELARALASVGLTSWLDKLPLGLETRIGSEYDDGAGMSGGQWQRLALARLLLQDRPVWLLDEPTSALDPEADRAFMELVVANKEPRLILMITHRHDGLTYADDVFSMENGRMLLVDT